MCNQVVRKAKVVVSVIIHLKIGLLSNFFAGNHGMVCGEIANGESSSPCLLLDRLSSVEDKRYFIFSIVYPTKHYHNIKIYEFYLFLTCRVSIFIVSD